MKNHPSKNPEFFEDAPKIGTNEFEQSKKEAGVVDWFEAFSRRIETARESNDAVLLENSISAMEQDASSAVAKALKNGDIVAARSVLNRIEEISKKHNLNVKEILESQREHMVREKLDELDELGASGVLERVNMMIRSDELPFNETDSSLILKMAEEALKAGNCDTVDDAIILGAVKRNDARPKSGNLYVIMDKTGYVAGAGGSRREAIEKLK